MIREIPDHGWRKRFALLPFTLPNGPTKTFVWWEPYWSRCGGYFTEVSLSDPTREAGGRTGGGECSGRDPLPTPISGDQS